MTPLNRFLAESIKAQARPNLGEGYVPPYKKFEGMTAEEIYTATLKIITRDRLSPQFPGTFQEREDRQSIEFLHRASKRAMSDHGEVPITTEQAKLIFGRYQTHDQRMVYMLDAARKLPSIEVDSPRRSKEA